MIQTDDQTTEVMVEIFKTNVQEDVSAKQLAHKLLAHFPGYRINFDLHDCDNILRVEGNDVIPEKIIELVASDGYQCQVLD